ncbi:hypothetical protein OUZ56_021818 [Daphnia magna]|uniref:Uncharacterized protein n=1 Tax=Daphnia magna TaxID=35525 RepID=A0ABR0AUN2_9CRUS|nr:hypothetical protein OUZ56_021818 [Daphnia magna]
MDKIILVSRHSPLGLPSGTVFSSLELQASQILRLDTTTRCNRSERVLSEMGRIESLRIPPFRTPFPRQDSQGAGDDLWEEPILRVIDKTQPNFMPK